MERIELIGIKCPKCRKDLEFRLDIDKWSYWCPEHGILLKRKHSILLKKYG